LVRLSLPGKNLGWPDGDAATRQAIFAEHLRDNVGLLFFLQNDFAVPAKFRDEAREWGWCRDEFTETGGLPPQLYVREARRMQGVRIFTQRDSEHAPDDARAVLHRDVIAMGDYGNNCHGTAREGTRFVGKHAGEFYNPVPPYQIPYGTLLPREVDNLLVPVAASSSHVGFCALRLEPIWMSLGQAAGHAAALAVKENSTVQRVNVPALQRRLHADSSALIYVSDVLPGHADWAAVQWWGAGGGLHGLAPMPAKPGQRGKNLHGQYFEANPGHTVDLKAPLDEALATRWRKLAGDFGLATESLPKSDGKATRGDFIRAVARLNKAE
jgi:FAD dependent oxidoreductase